MLLHASKNKHPWENHKIFLLLEIQNYIHRHRKVYKGVCLQYYMTNQIDRRNKILTILNSVKQCGENGCNKEKLLGQISLELGASRRTAMEYVSVLLIQGQIVQEEGDLFYANKTEVTREDEKVVSTTS